MGLLWCLNLASHQFGSLGLQNTLPVDFIFPPELICGDICLKALLMLVISNNLRDVEGSPWPCWAASRSRGAGWVSARWCPARSPHQQRRRRPSSPAPAAAPAPAAQCSSSSWAECPFTIPFKVEAAGFSMLGSLTGARSGMISPVPRCQVPGSGSWEPLLGRSWFWGWLVTVRIRTPHWEYQAEADSYCRQMRKVLEVTSYHTVTIPYLLCHCLVIWNELN